MLARGVVRSRPAGLQDSRRLGVCVYPTNKFTVRSNAMQVQSFNPQRSLFSGELFFVESGEVQM